MENKPIILITGARGFVGSRVADFLREAGFGVRIFEGDIKNLDSVLEATKGVEKVVHLAARKNDEKDSFEVNVAGAKNLVETCRQNSVKLIVNISTISTKISQKGIYAQSKNQADEIFKQSRIPTVTLKPSLIYGDLENAAFGSLAKLAKLPVAPVFGSGQCRFRPIYIGDVCQAIRVALTDEKLKNQTYDVVGPDAISMNNLLKLIGQKIYGKKVKLVHLPSKMGLFLAGIIFTKSNVLGSTQDVAMDYESFSKDFGFEPVGLEEGLRILKIEAEADSILNYVVSRSFPKIKITEREREIYIKAVSNKNLSKKEKIIVAAAVVECSPSSAQWLLPKKRSLFEIFWRSLFLVISALTSPVRNFFFSNGVKINER